MYALKDAEPKWLYLHGFASGPESAKGRALAAHFAREGVLLERLDLRIPSLERLRLGKMIDHVSDRIGGPSARAVVIGSSLGGLTAARVAERDARVAALVLLAPAFRIAERWRQRIGDDEWNRWRDSGWLAIDDHAAPAGAPKARVDFAFIDEAGRIDAGGHERAPGWPDVRVPTLIVHGTRDETVGIDLSRTWARGKRHVRLVEVDDGHDLAGSIARICEESDAFLAPFLGAA
jgi:pimeloyl-ACP methyl ester carboxylesterase